MGNPSSRPTGNRILGWKDRLKLIGDLMEIVRDSEKSKRLTPQQKRRATTIKRKLEFNGRESEKPLLRR